MLVYAVTMLSRSIKLAFIGALYRTCGLIDDVAYRPAVVKLTRRLPWFWCCQLSHLSMTLDDRWQTGFWQGPNTPPAPDGPCDACGRRAAWLEVGGHYEGIDEDEDDVDADPVDYLRSHPASLCGWCHLNVDPRSPPLTAEDLDRLLRDAGSRSIGWRWRWHPG